MSDPFIYPLLYTLPVLVSLSSSLTPESDGSPTDDRLIAASVETMMTACNLNHTLRRRFIMGGLMLPVQWLIINVEERRKTCKRDYFIDTYIHLPLHKRLPLICVTMLSATLRLALVFGLSNLKKKVINKVFTLPPNTITWQLMGTDSQPDSATTTTTC